MHYRNIPKTLLFLLLCCPSMGLTGCSAVVQGDTGSFSPADYVNPFIGASTSTSAAGVYHGLGKTFPGATTPYGMVQVSPNTITGEDNSPGYSYEHTTIEGFAFTQMSGVGWFGDLGNLLVMPTTGPLQKIAGREDGSIGGYRSHYDKATETARAGYYSALLTDYGIRAESSATPHCGILRFTFPEGEQSRIQIDLARRVGGTAERQYIEVVDKHTIAGWMKCTPATGGWGNGEGQADYTVYFYAQVDKPMENYGFWSADIPDDWVRKRDEVVSVPYLQRVAAAPVVTGIDRIEGRHIGFYTEFGTRQDEQVILRAGISFVDMEGARKNFEAEIAGKAFDQVAREARELWNRELARICIDGGSDRQKTIFYTALYHTMIDPRIYTDADGRYPGADGRIHTTGGRFTKRTIFSGWDVFRSQMPLQTIINPQLVSDLVNSLVTMADESGRHYFERWEIVNAYSGCMLGNPALSVLADAYAKGIRSYDVEKAYRYAVNSSKRFGNDPLGYTPSELCISHTLEYAYADWCISRLAEQLGKREDAALYAAKGQAYRNIFDREKGWFRPRRADGAWEPWPENARTTEWYGCIESNPYQQGWFVPHDVEGMVELMGGREAVLRDLTEFFDKTPSDMLWNDYYNHANEPVHLVPFLFNRLGQPWQTQKWTRHICEKAYADKVEGIVGNEDAGQMSAWYVLAAAGLHPACPGDTRMEITSPVFDRIGTAPRPGLRAGRDIHRRGARQQPLERLHTAGGAQRQGAHSIAPRLRRHCGRRDARTLHGRHPQHPVGHIGNNRTNLIISLKIDDKPMENTVNKDRSRLRSSLRRIAAAGLFGLCSLSAAFAQKQDYVQYVNTLQGTDSKFELSYGNTYATTGMPYGMHTWGAQTGPNGEGWKYQYSVDKIRGFQQAHQCSPWMSDYAVYSLMPEVGELVVNEDARASKFSHANEIAKPHYYRVTLDNGITTEMAPTTRGVHLRFTYPRKGDAYLVLDGYFAMSGMKIDPAKRQISGWVNNQRFVNHPETFRNYFVIQFDRPFEEYGLWENEHDERFPGMTEGEGKGYGAYVRFKAGTKVQARAASSYISPEQALLTLDRELGADKNLEATRKRGAETWNALLGRIAVEGGTDEEIRTFYSCLFRANLFSRKFYERDAEGNPYYYSPYDGKVHAGYMYTDNGFWDTFRSQFPLTNILHPTMQGRYMNALLAAQEQCGWLPSWSAPGETGGMIGNHAISLLTDAWAKGIRTFDPQKALEAYAKEAMNKGPWGGANGRAGWKEYWQLGYVSYPESMGSTAQTLEYAYDDFCGYQLARMTGNKFYEEIFSRVMYNYRNVFDKESGFMRGRLKDGSWLAPFDPYEWGGPYCEGNAWHYNWSVFHDVQGLINLYGSDEAFTAKIDSVFTVPNVIRPGTYGGMIHEMKEMELAGMGQYAHGNQPIQHMIYLYSYAGQPWKTQYWSRQITGRLYNSSERGYPGDEDQGGMSSWYILSSLGIYSVCPGTDQYVLGSPVFRKATITMEDGRKFVIEADGNSQQNVYIQSATLNGKPLDKNYITYKDIADGGVMRLVMGPEPNKERGTGKDAAPFSLSRPE